MPKLVVVGLEWFVNPDHLPIFVAKEKGFFKEEGLDVSIVVPTVAEESFRLAAAGRVDFAVGEQANLLVARDKGLRIKSIGVLMEHTAVVFMYLRRTGIEKLADLKGRRLGYPGLDVDLAFIRTATAAAGLRPPDYALVNTGFNLTDALVSGQVDMVFGAFKNFEGVEAQLSGHDVGFFELKDYGVPDLYQLIFAASDETIRRSPALAAHFLRAVARGIELALKSPAEALDAYYQANPHLRGRLTEETFRATMPYYARTQAQSASRWHAVREYFLSRRLAKRRCRLTDLYTDRFAAR